ncbi:murein biosynthesis integral membrane protein MurJ [Chloroflexota bacterium]
MSRSRQIIQATAVVTVIVLMVKGLGFVEKVLLAYFFGTGIAVDAYLIAYGLPFSAYVVLREVIKASFLPTFLRTWQDSRPRAWLLFSVVGTVLLILLSAATICGMAFAEQLVALTAPGFRGAQRELAVRLTRMVMPALLFLGMSTLTTATLNAWKRFSRPALGDASFRAGPLIFLLGAGTVVAMAAGVVLGAMGKLVIETLGIGRHLRSLRPSLNLRLTEARTVGRLAAPLLAGLFFSLLVAPVVENAFASTTGVGGVSALAYSRKIVETLAAILPYTLGLVLLPFSSEMAADQDYEGLAAMLTSAIRALTLIFLPVTIGLMVFREPFVQVLFQRGAFDAASTQLTAGPLFFYALALLPFALEVIIIQFFFARQDTLTPVITDVAAFLLNVALIAPLMAAFGLGGIALAAALARSARVLALLFLFGRKVPAFRLLSMAPFAGQMAVAGSATAGALVGLALLVGGLDIEGFVALLAYLMIAAVVASAVFVGATYLLNVEEIRDLRRRARAWRSTG